MMSITKKRAIIYVDIDDTICETPETALKAGAPDYAKAQPYEDRIEMINRLFDNGYKIVYWTARGTGTGVDWRDVTEEQFQEWGVKHDQIQFNKPIYDIFIDDKNMNSDSFFKMMYDRGEE